MANEDVIVPPIGVTPPSVPVLSTNYRLVSLKECEGPRYFGKFSENKVLRGLLLHVCVGNKGANKTTIHGQSSYHNSIGSFSRTKQTITTNYDRIAFFADTNTPGRCFACLLEKHQESVHFFDLVKNNVASIGDMYVLVEPDRIDTYIGRTLARVTCKNRMIPLLHDPTLLPSVEINPGEAGDTRYFAKKIKTWNSAEQELAVRMFHVTVPCVIVKNATTQTKNVLVSIKKKLDRLFWKWM